MQSKHVSPQPRVMTVRELADQLGCHPNHIYRLAQANRLPIPVLRLGRKLLVAKADVEALLGYGDGSDALNK